MAKRSSSKRELIDTGKTKMFATHDLLLGVPLVRGDIEYARTKRGKPR